MNIAKNHFTRWHIAASLLIVPLLAQVLVPSLLGHASAASLGKALVRFDRMNASQATTGTVCAAASSGAAGTEATVKVTFPTGYTVSTTTSNWTVDTTNSGWPSGAQAWPGIDTATTASGQDVTFPSSNLTDTQTYCFNWTNSAALSVKSSASADNTGTITTQASGPTTIDTGNYATASVANNCGSGSQACDQIQVSASVNATFSFSLDATTAALGTLSTSGPTASSAINASVSTNAQGGWQMWAADTAGTPGLHSATAGKTIAYSPSAGAAASALTNGTEGYNLGSGTISGTTCGTPTYGNFASGGVNYKGSGLDGTLRTLVTTTGAANACQLPLTVNASISATTPAATDYAGTVNVVAAGMF